MTDYPMTVNAQGVEIVDSSDAAWATYRAEGRDQLARAEAAHAENRHQLEMAKAEGLNAIDSVRFDAEILADARRMHNQDPSGPSVDEIIEKQVIPIREKYLAWFNSSAPAAPKKVGANLAVFERLIGERNE